MNILITGAAGFIGHHLADHLATSNGVYGLVHDRKPRSSLGWEPIVGNVTDYARMLEIITDLGVDQIYHCAAKSVVRNCRIDPLGCFRVNMLGVACILEAARQSERIQGVMCIESDKSYGDGPTPYVEDQALNPGGIYEASKACAGHIARSYFHNYSIPVFTIRSANVYGPRDLQMSRLIPNTINRILQKQSPQITQGAGDFTREFIYVSDFVVCAVGLMSKKPWGEVFNVGSGETSTVREVIDLICNLASTSKVYEETVRPKTLTEISKQSLCLDKLRKWLPEFSCAFSLESGLRETIQWHKSR